uniref:Cu-transporting P1B-1 ATPase n=2 Tax=Amanita strobiliformis TaxID=67730 RepID=A0A2S1JL61_9AGAR|nr:Cu-transporting P1B-1 ATPase [Amanita strobiliformis]
MGTLHFTVVMETTIHIQNLHCNSCIDTIEESLYGLSPVPSSINASIELRSIRIVHEPTLLLPMVQQKLVDAGFNIQVEYSGALDGTKKVHSDTAVLMGKSGAHGQHCGWCRENAETPHVPLGRRELDVVPKTPTSDKGIASYDGYRLTIAIGGMTCASCTRTITDAVAPIPGVRNVSINLIENSGVCILDNGNLAELVRDSIDDCGYEVEIVSVEPVSRNVSASATTPSRTVALKVDGISSPQCLKKIMNAVEAMGDQLTVEKALTSHTDPILIVSYVPKPPSFSIRSIVAAIQLSNDPPYHVTISHPPTLEDLSKTVQARERRDMFFRLVFTIIAAIPTFVLGVVYMSLVKDGNPGKTYLMEPAWVGNASRLEWALLFVSTPVMFYSANIFHRKSIKEIRALWRKSRSATLFQRFVKFGSMNLLISSGVSVAYFSSLALLIMAATTPRSGDSDRTTYFDAVVFLTLFLLIGRFIEVRSKARTADAITALSALQPAEALLVVPDSLSPREISFEELEKGADGPPGCHSAGLSPGTKTERVPADFLEIGDITCVPHGATPPADGTIVPGEKSLFDESSLTGESRLVTRESGDKVHVGTINKGRMVHVRVDTIGGKTMLDDIIRVVREGQTHKAPIERVADAITGYFVPVITLLAILTWLIWLTLGYSNLLPRDYLDIELGGWVVWSLGFAIAVFVVACPCGIGLAAPTAFLVGLGLAAKHGILARGGGEAFQEMSQIDIIVFDKTGTVTEGGEPRVSDFALLAEDTWNEELVKGIASELEIASTHPLARAIHGYCSSAKSATGLTMSSFEEVAGRGLRAEFDGLQCTAVLGSEKWIQEHEAELDNGLSRRLEAWKSEGKSVVVLAICDNKQPNGQRKFKIAAAFAVTDVVRPEATEVIAWFQKKGIETWMISGDDPKTASVVASMVGIPSENVIAGVLPHEKSEKVQQLQQGSRAKKSHKKNRTVVAMVGDGINDAPALSAADVGIAIGSGSDVAISSASFVLLSSNLRSLITLRDLSKTVIKRVKFNFAWALMYNIMAIPIAAGVIYPARRARLDPVWASLAMALSSCSVIASSLLLKTYKAPRITIEHKGAEPRSQ